MYLCVFVHAQAFNSLQEALRHQRDSWKVLENLTVGFAALYMRYIG